MIVGAYFLRVDLVELVCFLYLLLPHFYWFCTAWLILLLSVFVEEISIPTCLACYRRWIYYLAPLLWTISRVCMSFCVCWSHTVDAYSTIGLTSEKYAFCLLVVDQMFKFRRRKPNVLLAFPHVLLMRFVHRRSDVMRQPRYFASSTDVSGWLCSL